MVKKKVSFKTTSCPQTSFNFRPPKALKSELKKAKKTVQVTLC